MAEFARTQPQAAFAAFGQRVHLKWSFVARTVPNTADLLAPLEETIRSKVIPAIINRVPPGDFERAMLALGLKCRDGGLGIVNPPCLASQFQDSMHITKSLVQKILHQDQSAEGPGCHHHSQGRDCFPVPAPGEGSCYLGHCHLHQHRRAHFACCCRKVRLQLVGLLAPSTVWFQPTQAGVLGRSLPTAWLDPYRPANGMCVRQSVLTGTRVVLHNWWLPRHAAE